MSSPWFTTSSLLNGEISYYFRIIELTKEYADIEIVAYSITWEQFDVVIEYRLGEDYDWMDDIAITKTSADNFYKNVIYGLSASQYGTSNTFRWRFIQNDIVYGEDIQLKLGIPPRVRNYSTCFTTHALTEVYGESNVDFVTASQSRKVISKDRDGNYICIKDDLVYTIARLSQPESAIIYSWANVSDPRHVFHTESGTYIIADYGNNRVIELNSTMTAIVNSYAVANPVFVDYCHEDKTTLITAGNVVYEVVLELGSLIWQSAFSLSSPSSATYAYDDSDEIIICDYGNNRIVVYDRSTGVSTNIPRYYIRSTAGEHFDFYRPFRAYKIYDGTICIIEERGKDFLFSGTAELTSSSSSSSIDSSSSSSNSSSSSSLSSSSSSSN